MGRWFDPRAKALFLRPQQMISDIESYGHFVSLPLIQKSCLGLVVGHLGRNK